LWLIDPPYGVTEESWDIPFTAEQWEDLFNKIKSVEQMKDPYIFIFCTMTLAVTIIPTAIKCGLDLVARLGWVKPQVKSTGAIQKYQSQIEDILVFTRKNCKLQFQWTEGIPEQGGNIIIHPAVKQHSKDSAGEILNPCEKPW